MVANVACFIHSCLALGKSKFLSIQWCVYFKTQVHAIICAHLCYSTFIYLYIHSHRTNTTLLFSFFFFMSCIFHWNQLEWRDLWINLHSFDAFNNKKHFYRILRFKFKNQKSNEYFSIFPFRRCLLFAIWVQITQRHSRLSFCIAITRSCCIIAQRNCMEKKSRKNNIPYINRNGIRYRLFLFRSNEESIHKPIQIFYIRTIARWMGTREVLCRWQVS